MWEIYALELHGNVYTVVSEIIVQDNCRKFIHCVIFSWVCCTHENLTLELISACVHFSPYKN